MSERMRIQRKREKAITLPVESETLQRSPAAPEQAMNEVPSIVQEVLSSSGQPLDADVQAYMEPRFGHDFSRVRVHTDERAVDSARAVEALAYTVGSDVVFGAGQYAPETSGGKKLIAHELAHVVQQSGNTGTPQALTLEVPDSPSEMEAKESASAVVENQPLSQVSTIQADATIQCTALGEIVGGVRGAVAGGVEGFQAGGPVGAIVGGIEGAWIGAALGEAATGTAFHVVHTTHGTFNVYPDDFVGPLPVSDYVTQGWPVRLSVFIRIEAVINTISGGIGKITIGGDNAFKTSVLTDLAWLMTVNVGQDLLQALTASGKTLTINPTTGGNSTSYIPDADSYEQPDGTLGPGANVTINYNTAEWNPYGGVEDWMRRPPAIGLAHEMVHAWTGLIGTRALGETARVRRRELQATGLGEFSTATNSENQFRQAFGLPLRPHY